MHCRVTVTITDIKTGRTREAERTVTLDAGEFEMCGKPTKRPIDVAQQDRLFRWAINEAADELCGRR